MVSIAVGQRPQDTAKASPASLRAAALWYPTIPEQPLRLSQDLFPQRLAHTAGYWPLFWTHFGGPGGIYLPHLTGMTAHSNGTVLGIQFRYDEEEIPVECREMGLVSGFGEGMSTPVHFTVDGPGGERIIGVEVYLELASERSMPSAHTFQGSMRSFKVCR